MIVGIDLGTTNSAVAWWHDGEAKLIPNALGEFLTPSAVSITDDEEILVGVAARERQTTHPRSTATTFKRLMGSTKPVMLQKTRFLPEDLSSLVLRNLKRDAEVHCGQEVTGAVITVPAYFNDRQRRATRRAGELAGLKVKRLVNEPTAAALAYGIADREDREPFLVFDLGGGTFDVSIVEVFDGIVEVRASAGDNRLGGEDFTDVILNLARSALNLPAAFEDLHLAEQARAAAERTKRALSEGESATFSVLWNGEQHSTQITAAMFDGEAAPLIERLRAPVLRAMSDGNVRADAMSEIVLVGGATRMPLVRRTVTRMFGRFPNTALHPDHAIALGAAVQAGLVERKADLAEVRLTDVCPHSLGIDVMEVDQFGDARTGLFAPIIERNTVLPASRLKHFRTSMPMQPKVQFGIYQGEARNVIANVLLREVDIPVPPQSASTQIDCRFTYDVSGLLEVDVTIPASGETHQLVIYDEDNDDNIEERRAALASLKILPRDQERNRAIIGRAEACFETFLGEKREVAGELLKYFEGVLEGQDPRAIAEAATEVSTQLDQLESERYL
ncbi:Hsp70 family protein [Sphingomonas phyllosphaerae]|uniref:Hsp70 family protein n=1 Tax=Sphingomonas phyllosphaerae TaxID=257003 RepID=UPI0003FC1789|nr:molecular chaperone HscC [Sphingomonas phyllosphaerae]